MLRIFNAVLYNPGECYQQIKQTMAKMQPALPACDHLHTEDRYKAAFNAHEYTRNMRYTTSQQIQQIYTAYKNNNPLWKSEILSTVYSCLTNRQRAAWDAAVEAGDKADPDSALMQQYNIQLVDLSHTRIPCLLYYINQLQDILGL